MRALIDHARTLPAATHLLLVARTTTEEARRLLQDARVALIDAEGNMRVDLFGIFLWTEGRPMHATHDKHSEPLVKLTGKAGAATQALLRDPQRWWQVNDLAAEADISAGLAHRLLSRLERDSLMAASLVHGTPEPANASRPDLSHHGERKPRIVTVVIHDASPRSPAWVVATPCALQVVRSSWRLYLDPLNAPWCCVWTRRPRS